MRIKPSILVTAIIGSFTISSAFAADPQVATVATGDGVFNIRLGAAYVNMDVANGFGTVVDESDFTFITQPDNGAGISAVGGELSGDYWGPGLGLGGIYLGASILKVSDDNNSVLALPTTGPFPFLDTLPIDGSPSHGAITAGPGAQANVSVDADFHRLAASAGYALPTQTAGTNVALGLYGAYSQLNFDAATKPVGGGGFANLSEDVNVASVGPMVAFQKTVPLTETVEGFIEGQVALLYARGNFDATQSASNISGISLSSHEGDIAGMAEGRAGVSVLAFGGGKLSLFGGLGVRNDVYKIVNPRSEPGLVASNAASYHPGPATIQQTIQYSVSVGAKFAIQF
ncbi:hypothetical protein NKJ52_28700 [Mesorhizobium australicum]|uniref:hypothetical protein n=1 Tax=Mesorhizobium australicum TaxID=536018 RepID=UPI003336F19E